MENLNSLSQQAEVSSLSLATVSVYPMLVDTTQEETTSSSISNIKILPGSHQDAGLGAKDLEEALW